MSMLSIMSDDSTGVKCSAAAFITMRPTAPLPVYMIRSNRSFKTAVVSATAPSITAITSRSKYLGINSASVYDNYIISYHMSYQYGRNEIAIAAD